MRGVLRPILNFQSAEKFVMDAKAKYDKESIRVDFILQEKNNCDQKILLLNNSIDLFDRTRVFLQHLSEYARILAKKKLEEIVTNALQFIFNDQRNFSIEIRNTQSRSEAEFFIVAADTEEKVPLQSCGGGVIDIVSVALRVALMETHQPRIEGPLILDEPFKHVSAEYIEAAGKLLEIIRDSFDRQVIMITHNESLKTVANRVFIVEKVDGVSEVTGQDVSK